MKYISLFFILTFVISCKKEQDTYKSNEISLLTSTAPYKCVIVAKGTSDNIPGILYVNAKCNLYVVEHYPYAGPRVIKYAIGSDQYGEIIAGNYDTLPSIHGIYVDENDVLFVTVTASFPRHNEIVKILPGDETVEPVFDFTAAGFNIDSLLTDSKTDSKGNFYIAYGDAVIKWTPGCEKATIVAGGNGSGPAANQLSGISAIDLDVNGTLYISDSGNKRIQKWESGASVGTTIVSDNQLLSSPEGIAVDENSNVYVNDSNKRIIKFCPGAPKGQVIIDQTTAGAGEDFTPVYIYSDKRGSLYISDKGNALVSKWNQ